MSISHALGDHSVTRSKRILIPRPTRIGLPNGRYFTGLASILLLI